MKSFEDLTDRQKLFSWSAGYFAAMVLAEEQAYAENVLRILSSLAHMMSQEEWEELGQYLSNNIEGTADIILTDTIPENNQDGEPTN